MKWLLGACLLSVVISCSDPPGPREPPRELPIPANPFGPDEPSYSPQPHRDRPSAVVHDAERGLLYVALTGSEEEPGREVSVVDASSFDVLSRIDVGPYPMGLALQPGGRFLVVTNRFARYASIVDLDQGRVTSELDVPYYTESDGPGVFLARDADGGGPPRRRLAGGVDGARRAR